MKKSTIFAIKAFLVIIIIGVFIFAVLDRHYTTTIKMNWSISLPVPTKQLFSIDNSGDSWFGDGVRYHVFTYHESTKIIKSLEWKSGRYPPVEIEILKVLETIGVPEANLPDFQRNYLYYTKKDRAFISTIYLIYFTDTKTLYVIEDII